MLAIMQSLEQARKNTLVTEGTSTWFNRLVFDAGKPGHYHFFCTSGDTAPNKKFNYRFTGKKN
jgi:hypothetical protein